MALAAPIQVAPPCFPLLCHPKRSALRCRMQRIAMTDAAHCDDRCSALRFPSHSKAVLREGFLPIPSFGFLPPPLPLGKLLSVSLVVRSSAFCRTGQRIQSHRPALSVAQASASCRTGQCILLREPMAWLVWETAVEMTWGWDCGTWGCGLWRLGWRVRGNRQVL